MVSKEKWFSSICFVAGMASFIAALVFGLNETITQDQKITYLYSLGGLGFLLVLLPSIPRRKRQKGGDAAFLRGDYATAKKEYKATKDLESSPEITLKLAFVDFAENKNPSNLRSYFRNDLFAFNKMTGINYKSVEDLAVKLNFKLNDDVYRVFREEEFECLKYFIDPWKAKRGGLSSINTWSTAIRVQPAGERLEAVWAGPIGSKLDINAFMHEKADNKIDIEVNEVFPAPNITVRYWDEGAAFEAAKLGEITDEAILSIVQKAEFDAKKYAEWIQKDAVSVVQDVLKFAKGRRMMNDIDSINMRITKIIPVFWLERIKPALLDAPGFKFRFYSWRYSLQINHALRIAFSSIPKEPIPSDKLLKSLINVEPSEIHFELPRL